MTRRLRVRPSYPYERRRLSCAHGHESCGCGCPMSCASCGLRVSQESRTDSVDVQHYTLPYMHFQLSHRDTRRDLAARTVTRRVAITHTGSHMSHDTSGHEPPHFAHNAQADTRHPPARARSCTEIVRHDPRAALASPSLPGCTSSSCSHSRAMRGHPIRAPPTAQCSHRSNPPRPEDTAEPG